MGTKVNHVDVVNSLTDPLECVREVVTACTDYLKISEEERTKRQQHLRSALAERQPIFSTEHFMKEICEFVDKELQPTIT
ncbi:MAG: hypothetical protein WAN66_16640 [Limnoraphis robusta]|uniref:Uncharacterized protein n=1 Tax=Limnoraphis robusta CS-951 TaxID=1637645 RepID=A0A0F5YHL2_9CYAN|nr:hypothetical protein [Limnoraphis robusta]KKD38399.1 hypothetical protein WN50_09040 [Limnoraphis robusta CS-951]